ncbi:P1 family peptidase [Pseudomonas sp. GD03651]|uniref:P1 family peptidase n=1 Tax=Pseudomonas TaxID=286 RepID=UPI001E2A999D|nr:MULTISPECIES: P1 family peptidase [Pseudomonas]MCE0782903.1 P1 family peptidase [Pseudomonas sp. NMI542_15]MDD2072181.1 P1 family peptidase [Pseudomonas putida]MDH2188204.1 P1 family peptidase [Pseudomonas sp. GD03651]MDP9542416.1 P1 family peptidase [Pseudomonas putida]
MSPLFAAAADAVEEAIVNAILAGRTLQTEDGREVPGLEGSRLLKALEQVGWKAQG